jgi:hypothetical protein
MSSVLRGAIMSEFPAPASRACLGAAGLYDEPIGSAKARLGNVPRRKKIVRSTDPRALSGLWRPCRASPTTEVQT